jgi:hypothetical protein
VCACASARRGGGGFAFSLAPAGRSVCCTAWPQAADLCVACASASAGGQGDIGAPVLVRRGADAGAGLLGFLGRGFAPGPHRARGAKGEAQQRRRHSRRGVMGIHNGTFGPYLAAIDRILISVLLRHPRRRILGSHASCVCPSRLSRRARRRPCAGPPQQRAPGTPKPCRPWDRRFRTWE